MFVIGIRKEMAKMEVLEMDRYYKGPQKIKLNNGLNQMSRSPVQVKLVKLSHLKHLVRKRYWAGSVKSSDY